MSGSPDTLIGDRAAARVGDEHHCPKHGTGRITQGAPTVLINGVPLARVSDLCSCNGGGAAAAGAPSAAPPPDDATALRVGPSPSLTAGPSPALETATTKEITVGAPTKPGQRACPTPLNPGGKAAAPFDVKPQGLVVRVPPTTPVEGAPKRMSLPLVHWNVVTSDKGTKVERGTAPSDASGSGVTTIGAGYDTVLIGDRGAGARPGGVGPADDPWMRPAADQRYDDTANKEAVQDMHDIVNGVNPEHGNVNCGKIIDAVVDRLSGDDPQATALTGRNGSFPAIEQRFETKLNWDSSFDDAFEAVRAGGDGTVAIVGIVYGNGASHVVTLANEDGHVAVLEGQSGGHVIASPEAAQAFYQPAKLGYGIVGSEKAP